MIEHSVRIPARLTEVERRRHLTAIPPIFGAAACLSRSGSWGLLLPGGFGADQRLTRCERKPALAVMQRPDGPGSELRHSAHRGAPRCCRGRDAAGTVEPSHQKTRIMRSQHPQRTRRLNRARRPRPDLREARIFMWAFSSSVSCSFVEFRNWRYRRGRTETYLTKPVSEHTKNIPGSRVA